MEACLAVLRGPAGQVAEREYRPALHCLFLVSKGVARIRALLGGAADGALALRGCLLPIAATDPRHALKARSAGESSLVAVLELAREGELQAGQEEGFGAIRLERAAACNG